jgi:phospholipid transport system substrate-binding protein
MVAMARIAAATVDTTAPLELVRSTTEVLLDDMRAHRADYAKDRSKLYAMAEEKVLPHFDFRRMSQWVLGRNWKQATPEQRDRFVTEFRTLLVRTYSTALLSYTDQQIVYQPVKAAPDADEVVVRTEVKNQTGRPPIPVFYSFYRNGDGEWKVFDVSIEGVSIVTNYRAVYASKIRETGMDGLIASIAAQNKSAAK